MIDLDVLVVYSSNLAMSASLADTKTTFPFHKDSPQNNYNLSYAHLLETCEKQGLSAGFTTSSDIIAPGTCESFWTRKQDKWQKNQGKAHSFNIFDKISPSSLERIQERKTLLADKLVRPFNHRSLFKLFFDKLSTYKNLPRYSIPTVYVTSSEDIDIENAVKKLETLKNNHAFPEDFKDTYVLKDRYGAGGNFVFEISLNPVQKIQQFMKENPEVHFILQPFLAFDKGFAYKNNQTATDIRLIFHQSDLLQCYLRMAKANDFRCNEHQGGELVYVNPTDIPEKIKVVARKMAQNINKPHSLYALDFAVSNNGNIYCIEGNTGPGIDWDIDKKINEKMSKELIRTIVTEFKNRLVVKKIPSISQHFSQKILIESPHSLHTV